MRLTLTKTAIVVIVLVLLASVLVAFDLYFDDVNNVKMAEHMMSEGALLRVNQSGLAEVRAFAAKYHGTTGGRQHSAQCLESDCLAVTSAPNEGFWGQHPKLRNWRVYVLRRTWRYFVFMWVENGKLVAQQQWFLYSTPTRNVAVITQTSEPSPELCGNQSYRLHHAFATNFSPHHFNVWVAPSAGAYKSLLNLNVSCATTITGCTSVSDIVPTAWQRYEADQQVIASRPGESEKTLNCR